MVFYLEGEDKKGGGLWYSIPLVIFSEEGTEISLIYNIREYASNSFNHLKFLNSANAH